MRYICPECSSTFREKKNLHQHLRKDHGLQKYKCKLCDFRTNSPNHLKRHEGVKHSNFELKCKQCEYTTSDQHNLNRHVRVKHLPKNIKCVSVLNSIRIGTRKSFRFNSFLLKFYFQSTFVKLT